MAATIYGEVADNRDAELLSWRRAIKRVTMLNKGQIDSYSRGGECLLLLQYFYAALLIPILTLALLAGCHATDLSGNPNETTDANELDSFSDLLDTDISVDIIEETSMDSISDTYSDEESFVDVMETIGDILYDRPIGICNVMNQTGCPSGYWCDIVPDFLYCLFYEVCLSSPPGTLFPGEECYPGHYPICAPGSHCWMVGGPDPDNRCLKWCYSDVDCVTFSTPCREIDETTGGYGSCVGVVMSYPDGLGYCR